MAAANKALAAWRKAKTQPTLIAALTAADGTEADVAELIAQAHAVAPGSQIGPTVALHEVRLLRLSKQLDAARARLAELPLETWPQATQNYFQLERFFLATTNEEAVAASMVKKVGGWTSDFGGPSESSTQLDQFETTRLLDVRLDTAELARLAALPSLPMTTRQSFAWTALARTAINAPKADLAPLIALVASVDAASVAPLSAAKAAPSIDERRLQVLKFLMTHPGVSVHLVPPDDRALNGKFVSTQFEMNGCMGLRNGWDGAGAVYARAAMELAKTNPKHALAPELLHLAVLFSKYTPGAPEAKQAFEVLHKQYGKTKFAADTPYFW